MADTRQNWFYGFLDLCLLALLRDGPDYGLSLSQRLVAAGVDEVPGGTLYPALLRLERQGLLVSESVASTSGPRRKYYALSPAGTRELDHLVGQWSEFRAALDRLTDGAARAITNAAPRIGTRAATAPGVRPGSATDQGDPR